MLVWLAFVFGPLSVLVLGGVIAALRARRDVWRPVLALAAISTLIWLVYVGLYQHETPCDGRSSGCPTVYGYGAPLPDQHIAGALLLLGGFMLPAVAFGWRRRLPPLTIGAALAVGPTLMAWWTTPRSDNDGLWTLIFWLVPVLGGLAVVVAAVAERIEGPHRVIAAGHRRRFASAGDRMAALAIDIGLVAAVLAVPLTALNNRHLGVVAVVVGIGLTTVYLGVAIAWKGRTLGQTLVGVFTVDFRSGRRVGATRAVIRSLVVVLEVAGVPTLILALPAGAELLALSASGRTITDRLLGTSVVSHREAAGAPPSVVVER